MKIGKSIDKLFERNEIIALWYETDKSYKVMFWRGMAWSLPKNYRKYHIKRIFGTISQSIAESDTINILVKCKPIQVHCGTCAYRGTMDCPNSSKCYARQDKPCWKWKTDLND